MPRLPSELLEPVAPAPPLVASPNLGGFGNKYELPELLDKAAQPDVPLGPLSGSPDLGDHVPGLRFLVAGVGGRSRGLGEWSVFSHGWPWPLC